MNHSNRAVDGKRNILIRFPNIMKMEGYALHYRSLRLQKLTGWTHIYGSLEDEGFKASQCVASITLPGN